ncbi:IS3 family transposase, partial [Lewinellaceae bacterium SD302]
ESFFKTIKRECIYKHAFRCSRTAFTTIFRYIEGWYNTRRIHTTIGNVAPLQLRLMKLNSKRAA